MIPQRFWNKTRLTTSGCIVWTAARDEKGYGLFQKPVGEGSGTIRAHLWLWRTVRGPVPVGLELDHLCRNRSCVNLEHLEAITHRENVLRGDGLAAQNARKTHCKRGHELTTDPSQPWRRQCVICARARKRAYKVRQRAKRTVS